MQIKSTGYNSKQNPIHFTSWLTEGDKKSEETTTSTRSHSRLPSLVDPKATWTFGLHKEPFTLHRSKTKDSRQICSDSKTRDSRQICSCSTSDGNLPFRCIPAWTPQVIPSHVNIRSGAAYLQKYHFNVETKYFTLTCSRAKTLLFVLKIQRFPTSKMATMSPACTSVTSPTPPYVVLS